MALRINLNTAALTAHRLLSGNDSALSKTMERLSSGYKINSAADDPAGLVISEKLRAQVGGLEQAIKNAGDAVNMVKTAEGALVEVQSLVQSMRDLAVHAANAGANDDAAIIADQNQIKNARVSIDKIGQETQFGAKKLLDGSAGVRVTVIGSQVTSANLNYATTLAATDTLSITTTQAAQQATLTTAALAANDTTALAGNQSFVLNGKTYSFTAGVDTATTIVAAINADSATTNVTATLSGGNNGTVVITSIAYGSDASVQITGASAGVLAGGAASQADIGQDVQAQVTHTGGGAGNVSDATWTAGKGTNLKDSLGNEIFLTTAAAAAAPGALTTTLSSVKGSMTFQVGAYAGQTRDISIPAILSAALGLGAVTGLSVDNIDVTTPQGAQDAINVLDKALADISSIRADLGATQKNVLESSINSLSVAKENIAASESTIRDTDMAAEVVNLTKNQILQQAGVSMLAQANQTPQTLLKLLQ
ncbi:MAG: flagellin N-terminal helical domain-containing protein [Armatimonadota bacterium]